MSDMIDLQPQESLESLASSVNINTEFLDEIALEHFQGKVNI